MPNALEITPRGVKRLLSRFEPVVDSARLGQRRSASVSLCITPGGSGPWALVEEHKDLWAHAAATLSIRTVMNEMDSRRWQRQRMANIYAPDRKREQRVAVRKLLILRDGETHDWWPAFTKLDALAGTFT